MSARGHSTTSEGRCGTTGSNRTPRWRRPGLALAACALLALTVGATGPEDGVEAGFEIALTGEHADLGQVLERAALDPQPGLAVSSSDDGRYVAFVAPSELGGTDVVLSDTWAGDAVELPNAFDAEISADGRRLGFTGSAAEKRRAGPLQVYVYDVETRAVSVASLDASGTPAAGHSFAPSISADGRLVAFATEAALTKSDSDHTLDVYVRDLETGETTLVSIDTLGEDLGAAFAPVISSDGRQVAFTAMAADGSLSVLRRDFWLGETVAVSATGRDAFAAGLDQQRAAYLGIEEDGLGLYLLDLATGEQQRLASADLGAVTEPLLERLKMDDCFVSYRRISEVHGERIAETVRVPTGDCPEQGEDERERADDEAEDDAVATSPATKSLLTGLVAHYKLDGSGTTATDETGSYNGTLTSGVTRISGGKDGGAVRFTDNGDDYISLPHQVLDGRTDVSVSLWIKTTKQGQQGIVSGAKSGGTSNEFLAFLSNDTAFKQHEHGVGRTWTIPSVADGAWHHLVIVRDATSNQVRFYLDNVDKGAQSFTLNALDIASGGLLLAQEQDSVGGGFNSGQDFVGDLDDMRVYDRLLSADDVDDLYNFASSGGYVVREYWTNFNGSSLDDIPESTTPSGTSNITSLEGPTAFGDHYATRIEGYITAPSTGDYTFWIASDDQSKLWLSTDDDPANKALIAQVTGWTTSRDWDKYPSDQKSSAINLTEGQDYYFKVLHREGSGGDNVAVGWAKPGESTTEPSEIVPGSVLSPYTGGPGPSPTLTAEAGTETVGSSWQTINLTKSFTSPVVIATPQYGSGSVPVVTRVRNVSASSFQLKVQRADTSTGGLSGYTVHWLAVEEGTYSSPKLEAKTFSSTVTDRKNSWSAQSVSYSNSYSKPVVLGQVMTANDSDWSAFWANGGSQYTPPTSSTLKVGKHVAEDSDTTRSNETLGYIVIEEGSGTIDGIDYLASASTDSGDDKVYGFANSPPYSYSYSGISPTVAITSAVAMDGGDGGWPILYGSNPLASGNIDLAFDEDTIGDSERAHTHEEVPYILLEVSGTTDPQEIRVTQGGSNVADGGSFGFGSTTVGSAVNKTFTIHNDGDDDLTVGSVSVPSGFTVTDQPSGTVSGGSSTTFTVRLNAGSAGSYSGTLSFTNNDSNENPYNFTISGTVSDTASPQEIRVTQSGSNVADGGSFGFGSTTVGSAVNKTFTIHNDGDDNLTVGSVSVPSGFTVTDQPSGTVSGGSSTTFTVRLNASSAGSYSGSLSFSNNDSNENPFNFTISGTVTSGTAGSCPDFSGGFFSTSGLTLNGDPAIAGNTLRLTDGSQGRDGTAYCTEQVDISTFETEFAFQLTNPNADGFTFVVQSESVNAIGPSPSGGTGLAYEGMGSSAALKFDLYPASSQGNTIGVYTNGATPATPYTSVGGGVDFTDGDPHTAKLVYDGTNLEVTITNTIDGDQYTTSFPVDIPSAVGGNLAWVGFTAATGGLTATQDILAWSFESGISTNDPAEISVVQAGNNIADGASFDFGETLEGLATSRTFFVFNDGDQDLSLGSVSVPSGYSVTTQPASTVSGGEQTSFTVALDANSSGTYSGTLSFSTNDSNENPFNLSLTGDVVTAPSCGSPGPGGVRLGLAFPGAVNVRLNGDSTVTNGQLRLGSDGKFTRSSIFSSNAVDVRAFQVRARFRLADNGGCFADGITFTVQNDSATALGGTGGGLAFGPDPVYSSDPVRGANIPSSVAVKFDLYNNAGEGPNSTGKFENGVSPTIPAVNLSGSGVDLHSEHKHEIRISYDGTTLTSTIEDLETGSSKTDSWTIDIPAVIGSNSGYIGYTGATGACTAEQDLLFDFSFDTTRGVATWDAANVEIDLSWDEVPGVCGYTILRSTTPGGPYDTVVASDLDPQTTTFSDENVNAGTTYYYVIEESSTGHVISNEFFASGKIPTTTAVSSSATAIQVGDSVTLTANVTANAGSGTPTGSVEFYSGSTLLGTQTLSGGSASLSTSDLGAGTHTIVAKYLGSSAYEQSVTDLTQAVEIVVSSGPEPTGTTIQASASTISLGSSVTFTATVSPKDGTGTPTGTVTIYDGGNSLGTNTLSGGVATLSTTSLTVGIHTITASYGGDDDFEASSVPGSAGATVEVTCSVPSTPTLTSAVGGVKQVTVSWNAVSGADYYSVWQYTYADPNPQYTKVKDNLTSLSTTVTGLADGAQYAFRVRAHNACGQSPLSNGIARFTIPAVPTGVSGTCGTNQITVNWSTVAGATQYHIYRYNGSAYVQVGSVNHPTSSWTDTGRAAGTYYYHRVKSYNVSGESAISQTFSYVQTLPAATTLSGTPGNGQVTLSWNAVTGATGYRVQRCVTSSCSYTDLATNHQGTSFNAGGLTNGTQYSFRVFAKDSCGQGPTSNVVSKTPTCPTPSAATVSLGEVYSGTVKFSWTPAAGATGYDVYSYTFSGGLVNIATNYQSTSFTANGLTNDILYQFYVVGRNSCGLGPNSNVVQATPTVGGGPLVFKLNWNSNDDLDLHVITPNGYHIYYSNKVSPDGGRLDKDCRNLGNTNCTSYPLEENIYWSGTPPTGTYQVYAVFYDDDGPLGANPAQALYAYKNGVLVAAWPINLQTEDQQSQVFNINWP